MEKYKHSIPVQLRFNDTDALGHVNNSVYLSFYDLGKTAYFQTLNKGEKVEQKEVDIVVAHIDVDFISPVFLTDEIAVQTRVESIGNKSFSLKQRIVDTKTGLEKCVCRTIMVGFDFKNNCTKPISEKWRQSIEEYEERTF